MELYTVPNKYGAQIPLKTEVRDKLSSLDVVWGNMFEGEDIDPQLVLEKEAEFYRGAPPQWLNFYCAEKNHTPFVKRDIYTKITELIQKKSEINHSISSINLFHQPGSGGTTLAMQVLWDLRKKLRCARVIDSTSDSKAIAQQVIHLFNLGDSKNQNTVLLFVDNKQTEENDGMQFNSLREILIQNIKHSNINANAPVVIILNCLRKKARLMLCTSLSKEEQENFHAKHMEVSQRHDSHKEFHGFNIMQSNFSQTYITEACEYLKPLKTKKRPRNAQILSFLALMNSYAPGSYLTETWCLEFLDKKNHISGHPTLEKQMGAFADLLVIYSTCSGGAKSQDRCIRMAHPMIADKCLWLLTDAGVTLSDTAINLLSHLCPQTVQPYLVKIIKQLLKKRETHLPEGEREEKLQKFSNLIQDIKEKENKSMCVGLFRHAAMTFPNDPFIPQALARFYYIELTDYERAASWAKTAIRREPNNSFIRDTLGQVYKNQLKNTNLSKRSKAILQIGKQAFKAFEEEAETAEKEVEPGTQEDGVTNISTVFNYRGLFGYIQVANIIFYKLNKVNQEWSKVLRQETKSHSLIHSEESTEHQSLLTSLRQRIEEKLSFFETFLKYSKLKIDKSEPEYIWRDIEDCYKNYIRKEDEELSRSFAGLLSTLSHITISSSVSELEKITEQLREIHMNSQTESDAQNYILANTILSQKSANSEILQVLQDILQKLWERQDRNRSPEFYLLVLLLFWPDGEKKTGNTPDLKVCVQYMRQSYERTYHKYLRFRYLVPLFFLGNGGGLQRLVHQTKDTNLLVGETTEGLQRIEGEIRNHKVFALRGQDQIEVSPHNPASVYNTDLVSFYLGFTIRGPVAYNIRYVKKSAQFVDKHKKRIIQRAEKVDFIIDDLRPLIGTEQYSTIIAASTNNEKMEKLYSILSAGYEIKDTFYQSLLKNERDLIQDLINSGKSYS
ncbi:sterile alpha motif domain-containing protein 9-like [Carassius gibelio]|uniref:sterile alpha motif domain-containing protein 9-like n=1 Tax=Carassius gibelio TaxID=101364 RepID=UPI00227955A1|nr:sterile alpha motif domain-containing protein 9-like [Carassius gibelio]